jgi:hypothetical protein
MSIDTLKALVPPPPAPQETGTAQEWPAIEQQLGTALPDDYKALIQSYGSGGFNEFIYVHNPFAANPYRNLLALKETILDAYRTSQQNFPDEYPEPAFPQPGGVLPWARSDNGDEFFWRTEGDPNQWTVLVLKARNANQYRYALSTTDFLVQLLSNQLVPACYDDDFFDEVDPYFVARP